MNYFFFFLRSQYEQPHGPRARLPRTTTLTLYAVRLVGSPTMSGGAAVVRGVTVARCERN